MKKCIYTLKEEPEAGFKTEEHVIPACLGGIQKLPLGMVSDEVNAMFSVLEREFAEHSPISISRIFLGPGKRGKLAEKYAVPSQVSLMESKEDERIALGYIRMAKPYYIDCLQLELKDGKPTGNVRISLNTDNDLSNRERAERFLTLLEHPDWNSCQLLPERELQHEILFGFFNGKWFLGYGEKMGADEAKRLVNASIALLMEQRDECFDREMTGLVEQPWFHAQMNLSLRDFLRVYAKIAYNTLAYLKGGEYMVQDEFSGIRKAILTGEDIERYVHMVDADFDFLPKKILSQRGADKFGKSFHAVLICKVRDHLAAFVCFYGGVAPVLVDLTDQAERLVFGELDGWVCDWENRRELRVLDFLHEILEEG